MRDRAMDVELFDGLDDVQGRSDLRGLGGLLALAEEGETPLPLQFVRVRAEIVGDCCRTHVEQHFSNPLTKILHAVHMFPLPEQGSLVQMELVAGDVHVQAELRLREEAQEIFDAAMDAGLQAGLLTQERADVHTLHISNLPPGEEVTVRMTLVERLEVVDGEYRWRFPTVIAPRFLPGIPVSHHGMGILPDTDHVPDASHVQPPLRLKGGTELDLEVRIHGAIRNVRSSLHAIQLAMPQEEGQGLRVAPSQHATLDRDFILAVSMADESHSALRAFSDGEYTLAILESPALDPGPVFPRDAVFIVDVSGSMSGGKMQAAKTALKSAMHGLRSGDRFKCIAFSNQTSSFAQGFTSYDQDSLHAADQWIAKLSPGGGTNMLPAVQQALAGDRPEGRVSTVLLITDGQVWNEAELIAAVHYRRQQARFFTLGIDTAVSASLLNRLARVGAGTCELLTPDEDIEAAVARLELRFGSPLADALKVHVDGIVNPAARTLFRGRSVSWLFQGAPDQIRVCGDSPSGPVAWSAVIQQTSFALGVLWSREQVAALEDRLVLKPHEEEALRPEIERISLEHGIVSRCTAFVAVEHSRKADGEVIEIVQPVELPDAWDQGFLTLQDSGMGARTAGMMQKGIVMDASPLRCEFPSAHPQAPSHNLVLSPDVLEEETVSISRLLAVGQWADGSYAGDIASTGAALAALIFLGNTRRKGLRRRTVHKASDWLQGHASDELASQVLALLAAAEGGDTLDQLRDSFQDLLNQLLQAGEQGEILKQVLAQD